MFPTRSTRPVRIRRPLVAVLAASSMGLLAACGGSGDPTAEPLAPVAAPSPTIPAATNDATGSTVTAAGASDPDEMEDADDDSVGFPDQGPVEQPATGGSGSGGGSTPLEPVPQPSGPCADWTAGGAALVVGPDPQVLESGDLVAEISITNCSGATVAWTAKSVAVVGLDSAGGSLAAGHSAAVTATIDDDQVGPGAVDVKVKVSEPGHNHYVDLHAYDPLVGSDVVAGGGNLSPGDGAMGCALQCIVSAVLRPNLSTANVSLDVKATVAATFQVWVSTDEAELDGEVPSFPGVDPIAMSQDPSATWTANLSPLEAATTYQIIVAATDDNGYTAYRVGHFTTRSPIENPGGLADGGGASGCSAQCITSAIVTTHDDGTADLDVSAHTPATFQAFVSLDAPTYDGHVPGFADTVAWANSGEHRTDGWATTLTGLVPDTTHHIIVMATDAEGRHSYQVGQFHTPAGPMQVVRIGVHDVRLSDDGDRGGNRGEVSLAWGLGGVGLIGSVGEAKRDDGDVIGFGDFETYAIVETNGFAPTVYLDVFERDADGKIEFCEPPFGLQTEAGSDGDCDLDWGVGASGIVSLEAIEQLPLCAELGVGLGIGDVHCMVIVTSDGEARAQAVVSFEVV